MYSFYYSEFVTKSNEKINYIVTPVGPINYSKPSQVSHLITLPIPIYYLTEEEQDLLSSQVIIKFPYIYSCPIPLEKHQEITEKQNYLMDNLINYGSFLPNIQKTQQSQDFQQKQEQQYYQVSTENPQIVHQNILSTSNEKEELNNLSESKENMCLKFQNSSVFNNISIDQKNPALSQHNEFQYPSFFSYNNFRNQIMNNNHIKNDKYKLQEQSQHQQSSNQQPITPQSINQQSTLPQQLFNFNDLYDFQTPNNFINNNH